WFDQRYRVALEAPLKNPDTPQPTVPAAAAGAATPPTAPAVVPQETIDRTADLGVQEDELKHLTAIGKLTDRDAATKKQAIEAEIKTLWLPYRALSPAEDTRTWTAINKLVTDKVSLLRPQW